MDAVLEPCAVAGEACAFGGLQAKVAGVIVWDPDRWQVIEPEQMGQDLGVDLVGFDLCLGDGAGLQRVANSDGVDEGAEDSDHGPRVKSGLHGDLVKGREVALREVCDALAGGGEAMAEGDLAGIVEDDSFDIFLVQIETSEWHKIKSPVMTSQRAAASLKVSCDHRTGSGQNGNYLFELEAQPGGPMGRPDTTAGSKPITPIGRPRSVRPRSPGWDVDVLEHLVPNPVGCSLAQFVAGLQDDHARYDAPWNPESSHENGFKAHWELLPFGGASEICFVKRSDGDWDIKGRMLSDFENEAEKGSRVVSVPYDPADSEGSESTESAYYRMHQGQFHEGQFQLPGEDDAGLGPAGYGGFVESLDFSLVARANVRGTASPPGSAGFWSFSLLPDTRRVPQIEINVFDSKTKAIRGRIKLRFCGYLEAMAGTLSWDGPNLIRLGAPCCGEGDYRKLYGYFPKD